MSDLRALLSFASLREPNVEVRQNLSIGFARRRQVSAKHAKENSLFGSYHYRFGFGVIIEGFGAVLFTQAALFEASERQLVVDHLCRIDPGIAGFNPFGGASGTTQIIRPD